jgi:hypothetical protein
MSETDSYFKKGDIPDSYAGEHRDEVLMFIWSRGVAYPSEMARELNIHPEVINRILFELKRIGFIEKYYVPENPDIWISKRIPEMWRHGVFGYGSFCNFSWWKLADAGHEYMCAKMG